MMLRTLLLMMVLMTLSPIHGMIGRGEKIDITSSDSFTVIWEFEYAAGGTLDMTIDMSDTASMHKVNSTLQMMFCSDAQIEPVHSAHMNDVCAHKPFNYVKCLWQDSFGLDYKTNKVRDHAHFNITIPKEDWYYLVQLNCPYDDWTTTLNYVAMNPGGEYLSLSQVPFKALYNISTGVWAFCVVAWIYNWYRYRFFNITLQAVLTIVPFWQAVLSVLWSRYWHWASVNGTWNEDLDLAVTILDTWLSQGIFFGCLLLCARGWKITRDEFGKNALTRGVTCVVLVILANVLYTLLGGFLLFFLVIILSLTLRTLFAWVVENNHTLRIQLGLVRELPIPMQSTPVWTKFHMFKRFQGCVVIYVSVWIMFILWSSIFLRTTPWIREAISQSITFVMTLSVGYIFMMKPFNPFFFRLAHADGTGAEGEQQPFHLGTVWQPGMPVPPTPSERSFWFREPESDEPIMLVQMPSKLNHRGNRIHTHIVATPSPEDQPNFLIGGRSQQQRANTFSSSPTSAANASTRANRGDGNASDNSSWLSTLFNFGGRPAGYTRFDDNNSHEDDIRYEIDIDLDDTSQSSSPRNNDNSDHKSSNSMRAPV